MKHKAFYIDFLRTIFGDKPLAKMILSGNGYFLYDTGTNKILECGKEIFDLIKHLYSRDIDRAIADFIDSYGESKFLEVAEEIMLAINTEKILLTKPAGQFGLSEHFHDFEKSINTGMMSITLELTEQCNLRCGYCLYGDQFDQQRNHGQKHMSIETAYQAIRFLKERSSGGNSVYIGFYGGEPLLRFPIIKECVRYAREVIRDKTVKFNITTNAILIDEEIADFLITENFSILVSLDGPEEIHDRYRKDKRGQGSFKRTLNGLEKLVKKQRRHGTGTVAVNAVYTPPYTVEKLDTIQRFMAEQDWWPDVNVTLQYANYSSLKGLFKGDDLKEEKHLTTWAMDEYKQSFQHSSSMVKEQLEKRFAKLMQRGILAEPMDCYTLNGCCLPGQRKCYVSTDGALQVCEKMLCTNLPIGHLDTGFDLDTIKKIYIDDYAKKSLQTCSRCWALRLCDVCYSHAYNEQGQFDFKMKYRHCFTTLTGLEKSLGTFIALLAENPGNLDYLAEYEIQ